MFKLPISGCLSEDQMVLKAFTFIDFTKRMRADLINKIYGELSNILSI
jgi:hypothetical protein